MVGARLASMNPREILELLRRTPFQPFRVSLSSGESYVVSHPEQAFVDRFTLYVGLPSPKGLAEPFEEVVKIAMLHVVSAAPVNGRSKARGKGISK